MKTLTMIDRFKDYWNNYLPLSKRQAVTWLIKIEKELKEKEELEKAFEIIKSYPHLVKIILETVITYGKNNVKNYDLLKEVLSDGD